MNKKLLINILLSNLVLIVFLFLQYYITASEFLHNILRGTHGSNYYSDGILNYFLISTLILIAVIIYVKIKKVEYKSFIYYWIDILLSFWSLCIVPILLFAADIKVIIYYCIVFSIISYILYYFKNVRQQKI